MAKIEELKGLDLNKIKIPKLRDTVAKLLADYDEEPDKKLFKKTAKANIEKIHSLIQKHTPEAFGNGIQAENDPAEPKPKPEAKPNPDLDGQSDDEKQDSKTMRKEQSKKVMAEIEEIGKEIESCREQIREYNKKKKEAPGYKAPKKKSRLDKLKDKLVGIASLIPKNLGEDKSVINKTEKVLLHTLSELTVTWKMKVIKPAQDAIRQKFDQLEENIEP